MAMAVTMTRERFEEIAQNAYDALPDDFHDTIDNVYIVVEDYPSDETLKKMKAGRDSLLGLYEGVPLTQRGTWYGSTAVLPDKITLYQKNIEAVCEDDEEMELRIMEVLFHELGHYFGMDEAQVRKAMRRFM
jgi:predicted Zn-dependent protease with MMP-like domain